MSDEKKQGKKKPFNHEMLPLEQGKKYLLDIKRKQSFSKFVVNNWLREMIDRDIEDLEEVENLVLRRIFKHGAAIWLSPEGNIVYRPSVDADPIELSSDERAKRVFCSMMKEKNIKLFKGFTDKDGVHHKADIQAQELLVVSDEFTPFAASEFYVKDGLWKRTSFRPTSFMLINKPTKFPYPENIDKLIQNLCNNNADYYAWFMNWLAGFFQTLQKSHVAVVMRGDQGSGKSMFFEHVLMPLFGEKHCVVVDQARIESQFKNWIQNVLFYNLNEVAVDMKGRKYLKNFLKQLVTDTTVQAELKHKDAAVVPIYGNIYITSNEALPVEIEPSDRRFTVFQTGGSLRKMGWNTAELVTNIQSELVNFAKLLKTMRVDWEMYNTALDTPEKRAIQSGTNSKLSLFIQALLGKDILYFAELADIGNTESERENNKELHKRFTEQITKGKLKQDDLIKAYKELHDVDHSSKKVMENMRMLEPVIFAKEKFQSSNGGKWLTFPWGEE
ncbi:MAG: primase-helicase family protein [Deferribacterales bacterium]